MTLLSLALLLGACAGQPKLVPASGTNQDAEWPSMAWEQARGVRIWVDGDAWSGYPQELSEYVTPVFVRIQNNGTRPVRIAYSQFALVGANGFEYRVLPPFSLTRQDVGAKPPPPGVGQAYAQSGWYWDRRYPYDYPFGYYDYGHYYREWAPALPSREMVRRALPEGVIRPAGGISGFLYFDRAYEARAVVFRMRLVEADSGDRLEDITIPFVVRD